MKPILWAAARAPSSGINHQSTRKHHDPDRQGESYLDVGSVEVIQPGQELDEGVEWWTVIAGSGLLLVAGGLWFRRRRPDES